MIEPHAEAVNEEALEEAFWKFDEERKRTGAERDAFKHAMRRFARDHAASYVDLCEQAEIYVRAYKTGFEAPKGKSGASLLLRAIGDRLHALRFPV